MYQQQSLCWEWLLTSAQREVAESPRIQLVQCKDVSAPSLGSQLLRDLVGLVAMVGTCFYQPPVTSNC